jgi:dihydrofolate reductase
MRKIIESTLVSLDGVISDPQDWARWYFDGEAQEQATELLARSDAMLMGRNTYQALAMAWPNRTGDFADTINGIRKYVFSSTLQRADWNNATLVTDDIPAAVRRLKEADGNDLVIYGHGLLARTLLEHRLLDELRFSVHPVFVGRGTVLFREGPGTPLTLVGVTPRETGVVILTYQLTSRISDVDDPSLLTAVNSPSQT